MAKEFSTDNISAQDYQDLFGGPPGQQQEENKNSQKEEVEENGEDSE
jgi:hypothetical protein